MKQGIHPENYRTVVFKDFSCDYSFITKSCAPSKGTIKWEDGNEYPMIPPVIGLLYSCPPGASAFGCKDQVPCMESATRTKITPEGWVF